MDKIYIGEINSNYKYAQFGSNYIDLYNTSVLRANNTYEYYRVYFYDNTFVYTSGTNQRGSYSNDVYLQEVPVTNDLRYRRDFPMVILTIFIYLIIAIWLLNLITSGFRKGGVLHGLL